MNRPTLYLTAAARKSGRPNRHTLTITESITFRGDKRNMNELLWLIGSITGIALNVTWFCGTDYSKINQKTILPFAFMSSIFIFGTICFIVLFFQGFLKGANLRNIKEIKEK